MAISSRAIWYVVFPTYRYEEDLKALSKQLRLRIVDARFDNGDGATDVPSLTLKPEYQPKEAAAIVQKDSQSAIQAEPKAEAEVVEKPRKRAYTKREPATPVEPEGVTDVDTNKMAAE